MDVYDMHRLEDALGQQDEVEGSSSWEDGTWQEHAAACTSANVGTAPEKDDNSHEAADEWTCAICLEQVPPLDLAIIKGCEHIYHSHCILQWATCKEVPTCPQCKCSFSYLFCHRLLDGTPTDYPVEESVTLLKRAKWFEEYVKVAEKGKAVAASRAHLETFENDWVDEYEDYEEEDADFEEFLLDRQGGTSRVLIGNRRWGQGGFVRDGRMYARPVQQPPAPAASKSGKGKAPAAKGNAIQGDGQPGQGRRAKRNSKRSAADGKVIA